MKNILTQSLMIALSLASLPAYALYGRPTPVLTCASETASRRGGFSVTIFENGAEHFAELNWTDASDKRQLLSTPVSVSMYRCQPSARCLNSPTFYNSEDLNLTVQPPNSMDGDFRRGELVAEVNGQRIVEQVRCIRPMHIM